MKKPKYLKCRRWTCEEHDLCGGAYVGEGTTNLMGCPDYRHFVRKDKKKRKVA